MEGLFSKSIILTFFTWWYFEFLGQILRIFRFAVTSLIQSLSIPEILKTFFAPWKKTYDTVGGKSLNDKINAMVDNLISRGVGVTVRIFLIITSALLVVVYFFLLFAALALWLVGPILPFIVLTLGIFKING